MANQNIWKKENLDVIVQKKIMEILRSWPWLIQGFNS